jgi:hypothetical protein
MSNGSPGAGQVPPPALRCSHIHNTAKVAPTSINPDPECDGQCMLLTGHPHTGAREHVLALLGQQAGPYLAQEVSEFTGVWEYDPGACCKCSKCLRWVRDWGIGLIPPG